MLTKKQLAKELAAHGRYGDTELVHVSKDELRAFQHGLGSLTGENMTINPDTGLPEMFKWTSLIPAVVGIGGTVLTGGAMSPLLAGLISGAATTAATGGDWKQGVLSGISGGMMAGVGSGLVEMGVGAGADAAASAGAQSAIGAGAEAAGMGAMDAAGAGAMDMAGAGAMDSAAALGAENMASFGADAALDAGMDAGMTGAMDMGAGFGTDAAMTGGMMDGASAIGADNMASYGAEAALGEAAMPAMGEGMLSGMDVAADSGLGALAPTNQMTNTLVPQATGNASLSEAFGGKHLYDRTLPGLLGAASIANDAASGGGPGAPAQQAQKPIPPRRYLDTKYTPNTDMSYITKGGPAPKMFEQSYHYAQGGLASLEGDLDMQSTKRARALRARYRSKQDVVKDLNVAGSVAHQLGVTGPDDPVLTVAFGFTKKQGKKNISLSPQFAEGGQVEGPGDGMSDGIAAMIDGEQPAQIASGEYIVPADAVSHMGNGSSDAGAAELDNMVARIRQARTGSAEQAPQIDPRKMMPA